MQLVVGGDESALAELYDRFAAPLYRTALLRPGDRHLAEEVLQDTYLALWNRAELFDPSQGSLLGWLAVIARNRATDRLRALGRRPASLPLSSVLDDADTDGRAPDSVLHRAQPVAGVTAPADPERLVDDAWLRREVQRALAEIPDHERQVIQLAYYEELSQSEIAARLDWPLGTVKTRTRRALRHLRRTLSGALGVELGTRFATEDEPDGPS
ncbi:MAG TPA: sigma-70 family RNA polymerase sigma factor [Candidatus Caenarcaniphilales bacterium]|nr:sigma-70 family RNA polymerase sigma factor [Candidatus Caenarcaniphilales bacterium]